MKNKEPGSYLLAIECMTYNQSSYITDALEGFAMQQTSFPFVAVVVDDASTDGEQEVIKAYVDKHFDNSEEKGFKQWESEDARWTFARHKVNENCHIVAVCLKRNLFKEPEKKNAMVKEWMDAKYIALCEGDDYWTDPLKLQKQVDFLEDHPDYSLCCHRYKVCNQNEGTWDDDYVKPLFEESPNGFSFGNFENLNKVWITKTVTLVYRVNSINPSDLMKYHYRCDEHLNYHLLRNGLGYCFPFVGAVYRRCDTGIFSPLSEKEKIKRWCRIRDEMLKLNMTDSDIRNNVYHVLRWYLYDRQFCGEMVKLMITCVMSFYKTDGFKSSLFCAKKFLVSYVKGLKKRTRTDA